jgi:hypothetical protein
VSRGLQKGHLILVVEAEAAVLDWFVDAEESGVAQLLEDLVSREDLLLFPLVKRHWLSMMELPQLIFEIFHFFETSLNACYILMILIVVIPSIYVFWLAVK